MEPDAPKPSMIFEGLKNTHAVLSQITAVAPDTAESGKIAYPFDFKVGDGNRAEVIIHTPHGDIRLNNFLPEKIFLQHIEDTKSPVAVKRWGVNNNLIQIKISVDMEWVKDHPSVGIPALAHELGHALSTEGKEIPELPELPDNPKTPADVEQIVEFACNAVSDGLEEEMESWNYGKSVATLFGMDESVYESRMEEQMRSYKEEYFLKLQQILNEYVGKYNRNTQTQFQTPKLFKVYDVATQERVDMNYDQLTKIVSEASQEKANRAAAPQRTV
ncbi:MAG: hypothetical protein HYU80_03150 [Candidatus Blackburnbacteria bacterium]|nr:hypothetical protein [Candidatus Blackburnbacteria bacterium]